MARYVQPVPGGVIGRTDQGVDISAPPGTPIRAIADEQVVGIIPNWYAGQPFVWFRELGTNVYNYVAEQITNLPRRGQIFRAGQTVATVAQSGTALELGYATASGQTLAKATTGYTEGQVTPAGQRYRQQVIMGGGGPVRSSGPGPVPGYVPARFKSWVSGAASATGLPSSVVAAQIEDESSFDPNVTSSTGAQGMAQFEPSAWRTYGHGSPFNPHDAQQAYIRMMNALLRQYGGNIRNALAAYNAGSGNIQAGYGYADKILQQAGLPQSARRGRTGAGSPSFGGSRPGGGPANPPPAPSKVPQLFDNYLLVRDSPRTAPPNTKNPAAWFMASFTGNWANLGGKLGESPLSG